MSIVWKSTVLWLAIALVQVLRAALWPVATPRLWLALRRLLARVQRWAA